MIMSKQQELSNAQSPTTNTTTNATNVIDLGAPGTALGAPAALTRDIGPGTPVDIALMVTTAFAGEGTLTVKLVAADTTSLSGGVTVAQSGALTTSSLRAGAQIPLQFLTLKTNKRYLGAQYTLTTFTAGSISGGITAGPQTNSAPGRA